MGCADLYEEYGESLSRVEFDSMLYNNQAFRYYMIYKSLQKSCAVSSLGYKQEVCLKHTDSSTMILEMKVLFLVLLSHM